MYVVCEAVTVGGWTDIPCVRTVLCKISLIYYSDVYIWVYVLWLHYMYDVVMVCFIYKYFYYLKDESTR